jgi:glyoxylase I family protein
MPESKRSAQAGVVGGRLLGSDHFGIAVSDLDRSIAFWCDLLGFERVSAARAEGPWVDEIVGLNGAVIDEVIVRGPGISIALMKCLSPEGSPVRPLRNCDPGFTHFAFTCENIEAIFDRLQSAGIQIRSKGLVTIPTGDYAGAKDFYCLDPNGIGVELIETPTDQ